MNDVQEITLRNIEQAIEQRQRSRSVGRASVTIGGPEAEFFARQLALRGYKTALLKNGKGYRIYSGESR